MTPMTAVAPIVSRTTLVGAEIADLKGRFPPRPRPTLWTETAATSDEIIIRLQKPPLWSAGAATARLAGARFLLNWLGTFPGETWQQRWLTSPAHGPMDAWFDDTVQWGRSIGRKPNRSTLSSGILALISADVIRPDLPWLISRASRYLRPTIQAARDPEGFAQVEQLVPTEVLQTRYGSAALLVLAEFIAAYGGRVRDITVGEFLLRMELTESQRTRSVRLAYGWLRDMGQFPADAPATMRHIVTRAGQVGPDQLVDRYAIKCRPVRDLLVAYLLERQPGVDYSTLKGLSAELAGNFWADVEKHHPGIDSLHLPHEVAAAWKDRLSRKTVRRRQLDGSLAEFTQPRHNIAGIKSTVRAFYLDLIQWAMDEPERWGAWVVPCPISEAECSTKKNDLRQKAESDQRTRERLPVLPTLVRVADRRLKEARARLDALNAAPLGSTFAVLGETFAVPLTTTRSDGHPTQVRDVSGRPRHLGAEERRAFFAWATIEILRHTGVRIEELLELGHHSIISYRLPSTGQVVPLLQIAPSKTDQERLLLVAPELADVLSAVVSRVRRPDGRVPAIPSYDMHERVWNEPLPLLFQYEVGNEHRPFAVNFIRRALNETLAATGLTDSWGNLLLFQPHDFRRIFITDAILNGLPPHIAQVIAGHKTITTTMGYAAIYPADAIEAHRSFIARRRALRPTEEYRAVTPEEWQEFLGHFERRKLALGDCGRAYGTDCVHEHACVRCPVLIVQDEDQYRLVEIRDNLQERILEAEREGWLGEVEGLSVSLTAAEEKIAQLAARQDRRQAPVFLGVPTFTEVVGRSVAELPEPDDPAPTTGSAEAAEPSA
ncbi:MAG: site-specific integrase [Streptomyces sp.]